MKPGMRWVYRETSPGGVNKRVSVTVTNRTKTLANGVTARIVRDTITENGTFVETPRGRASACDRRLGQL
ncbi:MAG: hypothetical protein LH654_06530 [Thermoleophilia bacterium]|nr:hypothetical protein [Thermoleophilia bacterium]